MPHYFLEGLENDWRLVRETPSSQKFRVKTHNGHELAVDIHYTPSKVLTVNVVFHGDKSRFTDGLSHSVFHDLSMIALRKADYAVVDYTLAYSATLFDGNYSVDEEWRQVFRDTV